MGKYIQCLYPQVNSLKQRPEPIIPEKKKTSFGFALNILLVGKNQIGKSQDIYGIG